MNEVDFIRAFKFSTATIKQYKTIVIFIPSRRFCFESKKKL